MKGTFKVFVNGELFAECDNIVGTVGRNRMLTVEFKEPVNLSGDDTVRIEYDWRIDE